MTAVLCFSVLPATPGQTAEQAAVQEAEEIAVIAEEISLDPTWTYADFSVIHSGHAYLYRAAAERREIVVGINAGHGTANVGDAKTYCHPDQTPKTTGGTTAEGAVMACAISAGMTFTDGAAERDVNLIVAETLKDLLLQNGYDVLMLRESADEQLDNVARTVICNYTADCHIAIHFDSDGCTYDKGAFYMSVPEDLRAMEPVCSIWQEDEALGEALISGLSEYGTLLFEQGSMPMDLTQTSFSSIPSVDIELGNQCSDHSVQALARLAEGLAAGVDRYFTFLWER